MGLDAVYPTQPNYFYFSPSNQFQHTLDSHNFNTTGPVTWLPLSAGDYGIGWHGVINTTVCNMQPAQTDTLLATVHVRSALHMGVPNSGTLRGGSSLPEEGPGYYHSRGIDKLDTDDWAGDEAMRQLLVQSGLPWNQSHASPRFGVLDISKQGGGPFIGHSSHQNGLDADIRYVRNDGLELGLDLQTQSAAYSRQLTVELLNLLAASGQVAMVFVDPAAQITQSDVTGATVVVDPSGTHIDHFHIRIIDPDGDDSNVC